MDVGSCCKVSNISASRAEVNFCTDCRNLSHQQQSLLVLTHPDGQNPSWECQILNHFFWQLVISLYGIMELYRLQNWGPARANLPKNFWTTRHKTRAGFFMQWYGTEWPWILSLAGIILRSHYIIYSKAEVCVDGFVFYSTKERNEFSKLAIKKNSSE